jgi:nucleoid DNA-binding protein
MDRDELEEALAPRLGGRAAASAALEEILDVIIRTVVKGESVRITGFGVFEKIAQPAPDGRDPRTGKAVRVRGSAAPRFRPGKTFRKSVYDPNPRPPVGNTAKKAPGAIEEVPVEAENIDRYQQQHPEEPTRAVRREAALVRRYVAWLAKKGHDTTRHRVPTPGGTTMYTDLYDKSTKELIEAKSSSERQYVRLGLGQVLDYARLVAHDSKALLLPTQPPDHLLDLLNENAVACYLGRDRWPFCSPR